MLLTDEHDCAISIDTRSRSVFSKAAIEKKNKRIDQSANHHLHRSCIESFELSVIFVFLSHLLCHYKHALESLLLLHITFFSSYAKPLMIEQQ